MVSRPSCFKNCEPMCRQKKGRADNKSNERSGKHHLPEWVDCNDPFIKRMRHGECHRGNDHAENTSWDIVRAFAKGIKRAHSLDSTRRVSLVRPNQFQSPALCAPLIRLELSNRPVRS